jgi:hypothetical protein
VSGNSDPGGLVVVPNGPGFNYNGPYYFRPSFQFAGSGSRPSGKAPVGQPQPGNPQPAAPKTQPASPQPQDNPKQHVRAEPIVVSPASHTPIGVPSFLWVLLPIGLIVLAAVGALVFEPEGATEATAPGIAARAGTTTDARTVRPPPGPLVLLGFGVRRVFRGIAGIAGGLFGADDE